MATENLEIKVAKLETKVDTILDSVDQLNRKMDIIADDHITRRELDDFKNEITKRLQNPRFGEHASWCKKFIDHVKDKTGIKPLIYMSDSVLRMADWTPVSNGDYGLWVAGYPDACNSWDVSNFPFAIRPWSFYAIWQYTSSGGRLDRDVFSGDKTAWDKYANPSGNRVATTTPAPVVANKSNDDLATEVIRGLWGNGQERKARLESAGYNYWAVQQIVNNRLAPARRDTAEFYIVKSGDTLSGIAARYGTTYQEIARLSKIFLIQIQFS